MFNFYTNKGIFPNELKQVVITFLYKKDNPFDKANYRSISAFIYFTFELGALFALQTYFFSFVVLLFLQPK